MLLFLSPFEKESTLKVDPFPERTRGLQESKQEVTKVVSFVRNDGQSTKRIISL